MSELLGVQSRINNPFFLRVFIDSIMLDKSALVDLSSIEVEVKIGDCRQQILSKKETEGKKERENEGDEKDNRNMIIEENMVFEAKEDDMIQLFLNVKKQEGIEKFNHSNPGKEKEKIKVDTIGYCEFPLRKLLKIPKVVHCLEIDFAKEGLHKKKDEMASGMVEILALENNLGYLSISQIKLELTRDTDTGSYMDPYINFTIKNGQNSKKIRTLTKNEAGLKPVWNEEIEIEVSNLETVMQVEVYDEDTFTDDYVGTTGEIVVRENFFKISKRRQKLEVGLFYNNKSAGTIEFEYRFVVNET